jgi:hypothetical protein
MLTKRGKHDKNSYNIVFWPVFSDPDSAFKANADMDPAFKTNTVPYKIESESKYR